MKYPAKLIGFSIFLVVTLSLACQAVSNLPLARYTDTPVPLPSPTPTSLPLIPVQPGGENVDEPVFIYGDIPYTSPYFHNTISAPFVMLEDQAGFFQRDRQFNFPLLGQVIGPVEIQPDSTLTYSLSLPSIPQSTALDVDNDGNQDAGVQIFAVAYWSNTWGGPFLEERDGSGWSNAYTSTITDPERGDEIIGGILVVWAPDSEQSFPTGFGEDGLLFTSDDPMGSIPAGYNIVDLNQEPFSVFKQARTKIDLIEGPGAVNDYSNLSYDEAFDTLYQKVSREYPFTQEKQINWENLYQVHSKVVAEASTETEFFRALRDFAFSIPDAHISLSLFPEIFYEERGGGFGLVLRELSDRRVIVTDVFPELPAEEEGIQVGAEISVWDGLPIDEAISSVVPDFGPYSTDHHKRLEQIAFLTRVPPGENVEITYQNPGSPEPVETTLESVPEYDSLFESLPVFQKDKLALPVEGSLLPDTGLGYLRINTFSDDYNLLASSWNHFIERLQENEIPGLIIDLRNNSGGSGGIALDFASYFFDQEIPLYDGYYYSDESGEFESNGFPSSIKPGPLHYEGEIAVLVSPYCFSACEGFAYAMTQQNRSIIIGHYPTAGAFGEVGRGQYLLPDDLSMQFPTGRPLSPQGDVVIEGQGVKPDILVPVTEESASGQSDVILETAIDELLKKILE
jgi:C-terminal processing protease CtpA/Prc